MGRHRMTIRTKVLLAFGLVLAVTLGLGGFAMNRLAQVDAAARQIREVWLPGAQSVARMGLSLEQYRIAEGRALVAVSPEATRIVESDLKERSENLMRARAGYEAAIADETARDIAGTFDRAWAEYMAISRETLGLVREGARDQAALVYNGKERPPVARARDSAARLMEFNIRSGSAAARRGEQVYLAAAVWIGGALLLAIALCGAAACLVVASVSAPVLAIARTMQRLAEGDLGIAIPGVGRGDEIGTMAQALKVFRDHAVERAQAHAEQAEQASRAARAKEAALAELAEAVENEAATALDSVGRLTAAMAATADEMSVSAVRTGNSAHGAAIASAQALATVQSVAGAAEELAVSVRAIAAQVNRSVAVAGRTVGAGNETRATVEALNEQVVRVGAVADMIGAIADKTNRLALNATLEAARAGDVGKDFAAVAAEVKALAAHTARTTHEITQHIGQVRSAIGASATAVARLGHTIDGIDAIAGAIADSVAAQEQAAGQVARNVIETAAAGRDARPAPDSDVSNLGHPGIQVVRPPSGEADRAGAVRHPAGPVRLVHASVRERGVVG